MIIPARRPLSGSVTPSWYRTSRPNARICSTVLYLYYICICIFVPSWYRLFLSISTLYLSLFFVFLFVFDIVFVFYKNDVWLFRLSVVGYICRSLLCICICICILFVFVLHCICIVKECVVPSIRLPPVILVALHFPHTACVTGFHKLLPPTITNLICLGINTRKWWQS